MSSKSLLWYLTRLRAMNPEEIVTRLRRLVVEGRERRIARILRDFEDPYNEEAFELMRKELFGRKGIPGPERFLRPVPGVGPEWGKGKDRFDELFPGRKKQILLDADDLLSGGPVVFNTGRAWGEGEKPVWRRDPGSGMVRDLGFCFSADPYDYKAGNAKNIWEFNRHQHLPVLALGFFLSGDKKYTDEIRRQISGWLDENPPFSGINWASPLEAGLRIISWSVTLRFLGGRGIALLGDCFERLLRGVAVQAAFVGSHLSMGSSANNHLLGEAAGLVCAGAMFSVSEGEGAAGEWLGGGLSLIDRELVKQIHPDGVPAEQAFGYAPFVSDIAFAAGAAAAARTGSHAAPFSAPAKTALSTLTRFMAEISTMQGGIPPVGDSDDGRVIDLSAGRDDRYKAAISAAACLLDEQYPLPGGPEPDERSYWLLGGKHLPADPEQKHSTTPNPIPPPHTVKSNLYPDGGYALLRNSVTDILFDTGPLGYGNLAAHGHADSLSIVMSAFGRRILDDPGTYRYHGAPEIRNELRSTPVHNTITIARINQSEEAGLFQWLKKAETEIITIGAAESGLIFGVTAEHNGYTPVIHRRTVYSQPDGFFVLISDSIYNISPSSKKTRKEILRLMKADEKGLTGFLNWQFAPGLVPKPISAGTEGGWFLEVTPPQGLIILSTNGLPELRTGQVSRHFGELTEAPALRLHFGTDPTNGFTTETIFIPCKNPGSITHYTSTTQKTNSTKDIRLRTDSRTWTVTRYPGKNGNSKEHGLSITIDKKRFLFKRDATGALEPVPRSAWITDAS